MPEIAHTESSPKKVELETLKTPQVEQSDIAILVFHGMGQQVPFETLGDVAKNTAESTVWAEVGIKVNNEPLKVQNIRQIQKPKPQEDSEPSGLIARVRMSLHKDKDKPQKKRHLDFYECYWAPITEGKVGLFDVLVFLFGAGWGGIRFSWKMIFERYFWKATKKFPIPWLQNIPVLAFILTMIIALILSPLLVYQGFQQGTVKPILLDLSLLFAVMHLLLLPALVAVGLHLFATSEKSPFTIIFWVLLTLIPIVSYGFIFSRELSGHPLVFVPFIGHSLTFIQTGFSLWRPSASWWARLISWVLSLALVAALIWTVGSDNSNRYLTAAALVLNIALILSSYLFGGGKKKPFARVVMQAVTWIQAILAAFTLILGTIIVAARFSKSSLDWITGEWIKSVWTPSGWNVLWVVFYALLGLVTFLALRKFLIEYVGDVAAYLSGHKASKFAEVRSRIQAKAMEAAMHVYSSGYEKIILVGHSLGSVIAYDTYNRLVNLDASGDGSLNPKKKTFMLLTFGSPLNKIAFIFRNQVKDNHVREYLAASRQPLLEESHRYRPDFWINVWTRNDVISGKAHFFDAGEITRKPDNDKNEAKYCFDYKPDKDCDFDNPRPVIPLTDPEADIPFLAHTQYWKNKLIYEILVRAVASSRDEFGKFVKVKKIKPSDPAPKPVTVVELAPNESEQIKTE